MMRQQLQLKQMADVLSEIEGGSAAAGDAANCGAYAAWNGATLPSRWQGHVAGGRWQGQLRFNHPGVRSGQVQWSQDH